MAYGVVLFPSVHFAMRAEKAVKEKGLAVKLIPIPRHLSSDCGVGLRFLWEDKTAIEQILKLAAVPFDSLHPLSEGPPRP
ncbi:MAG TPA: DUF3343 domain-containing protein [Thermodesulfobacteriota bacterium]|nr:DUF3343 domain-containing protein [Thermodesulfobacteriota bacterium]